MGGYNVEGKGSTDDPLLNYDSNAFIKVFVWQWMNEFERCILTWKGELTGHWIKNHSKAWMKLPGWKSRCMGNIVISLTNKLFSIIFATFSIFFVVVIFLFHQLFNIMTMRKSKVFHYLQNNETGKSTTHNTVLWIKSMHARKWEVLHLTDIPFWISNVKV